MEARRWRRRAVCGAAGLAAVMVRLRPLPGVPSTASCYLETLHASAVQLMWLSWPCVRAAVHPGVPLRGDHDKARKSAAGTPVCGDVADEGAHAPPAAWRPSPTRASASHAAAAHILPRHLQVENHLATFPKLIGTDRQHNTVETAEVRAFFLPPPLAAARAELRADGSRRARSSVSGSLCVPAD